MAIKRYTATKDNTISDAYKSNLSGTATGSNMGFADTLEVFSIYGQISSSSGFTKERSRILIKFPATGTAGIKADRDAGLIPTSGNVNFYLNMYNAVTPNTLPKDFTLNVYALNAAGS